MTLCPAENLKRLVARKLVEDHGSHNGVHRSQPWLLDVKQSLMSAMSATLVKMEELREPLKMNDRWLRNTLLAGSRAVVTTQHTPGR